MSFFLDFISILGGSAALVAMAAFLAKLLIQNSLKKDLERYKATLHDETETHKARLALENARALDQAKFEFEKELIVRRGEVDFLRDERKYANETEQQRQARLQAQLQRWANPILGAIRDLRYRLSNIVDEQGYLGLSRTKVATAQWSADYQYFMSSTLYYFAQYFCWARLMQRELGHDLFDSSDAMKAFFEAIEKVADRLSRYPYDVTPASAGVVDDRQVFRLQQRAVGELLIEKTETVDRIVTYREFLDRRLDATDTAFQRHMDPLETFLSELAPGLDRRWTRIVAMRDALDEFQDLCESVLKA